MIGCTVPAATPHTSCFDRLSRKKEDFDAMIVISKEMVSEPKTEPMVYSALWKYQVIYTSLSALLFPD